MPAQNNFLERRHGEVRLADPTGSHQQKPMLRANGKIAREPLHHELRLFQAAIPRRRFRARVIEIRIEALKVAMQIALRQPRAFEDPRMAVLDRAIACYGPHRLRLARRGTSARAVPMNRDFIRRREALRFVVWPRLLDNSPARATAAQAAPCANFHGLWIAEPSIHARSLRAIMIWHVVEARFASARLGPFFLSSLRPASSAAFLRFAARAPVVWASRFVLTEKENGEHEESVCRQYEFSNDGSGFARALRAVWTGHAGPLGNGSRNGPRPGICVCRDAQRRGSSQGDCGPRRERGRRPQFEGE